jgi:hypothetical protein
MRTRSDILEDLINLNIRPAVLTEELAMYEWDSPSPIILIDIEVVSNVVSRYVKDEINYSDLEEWANAIECRDDIGFESTRLQEFISEIANTPINGLKTKAELLIFIQH